MLFGNVIPKTVYGPRAKLVILAEMFLKKIVFDFIDADHEVYKRSLESRFQTAKTIENN